MLFTRIPSGHAQTETYKNVDSTLYAYYRWCNNNIRDSVVLLKADTLFRLAGEKNDIRMQAVALSFKADHYYFNNELDSLKAWIPRVQAFARANEQPTYYFFTWSRLILYYTKHGQYTLAQYELERYMAQAEQDDYKPAIAEAYKQLGHIYRTRGLKETAADYYRKAIGFIEENNLNKFSLPILYSELATVLIDTGRYEEAAEELEKGKARLTLPEYIWPLKLKQVILYSRTGRSAEARTLFDQIRQGHDGYLTTASLTEAQLAINLAEHEFGRALTTLDKLIGLFKETGHSETYFYELFQTRAETYAETGNYEAAYKSQKHYLDLYRKKVGDDNERNLGEFATLLDVSRLDVEKAELQRQTQEVRLHRTQLGIAALSVILLLTVLFLLFTARMNRRLAHAKRAAEASSRMKGVFIRNITPARDQHPAQFHRRFRRAGCGPGRGRRRASVLHRNHPGKQRLPPETRGRRALYRGPRILRHPARIGSGGHQRLLHAVHSDRQGLQPPQTRHPLRTRMRTTSGQHLLPAALQGPDRTAAQRRTLRPRRPDHARLHPDLAQKADRLHGHGPGPRHPCRRSRAHLRPFRQTRPVLAGHGTGLGRLPADRRRIGRRGRTRHFLHGRGAFHAHNSNRLNIDYNHINVKS